ncbi:MAG: FAD-binding protein, partial [Alphaproteobacteria bacterium]
MALLLRDILVPVEQSRLDPARLVAETLGIAPKMVRNAVIQRRSIDARRKPRLYYVLAVSFETDREERLLRRYKKLSRFERPASPETVRLVHTPSVVVVGMGPAGLFAALELARGGAAVTLLERGRPVEQRIGDVDRFWRGDGLDPVSNVQFGEGGAGTFSDGKLTTRINHPDIRRILQTLVDCGAPRDILIDAKPHIGSDRLRAVLIRFRRLLQSLDVDMRFESCLTGFEIQNGRVTAAVVNDRDILPCQALVLAPGHSARDTYAMLKDKGVRLEAKPFAVGLRVAHPASLVNRIQYGSAVPAVGAADYRLAWNDPDSGRGVYSFCMCPGGEIINASSEPEHLVVNGMSRRRRNAPWSNSALVVSVGPKDFGPDVLSGVAFQRRLEHLAWRLGG